MTSVVTILNAPGQASFSDADAKAVHDALKAAGAHPATPAWLDPGVALDVPLGRLDPAAAAAVVWNALSGARIDVVVQPVADRRKRLLVADMDSTIIGQECLDELATRIGFGERVAALTERAMRGEIDFAAALTERVALFRAQPVALLERTFAEAVTLNRGARTLTATMHKHGAHCALVSGGFTFFTSRVAKAAGFDSFIGNEFDIRDGKLTGRIQGPIAGADAKRERLTQLLTELGIAREQTMGLGDGANDIPMLQAAGLGVAYHAKPKVRAAVAARIDYGDLTAALFIQGYRRDEFVES